MMTFLSINAWPRTARLCVVFAGLLLVACGEPEPPSINLYRAIHVGDLNQIKRHLYWGTDVNQPDPQGVFPLHVAARRGRVVIAGELIGHGADIDAKDADGQTPLQVALAAGKTQVGRLLVQRGAGDDPQQLLFRLVRGGVTDRDSFEFLIKQGADVNARDDAGATALHMAVGEGSPLLVKRLIERGADVNAVDAEGRTALTLAAIDGNRDIVALLKPFGARLEPAESTP